MKVLFLNTNMGYGGATKVMLWLAGRLSDSGNDVTFLTYRDESENREVPNGVKHIHIQLESRGHSFIGLFHSVNILHRFIKKGSYNIGIAFLTPSHLRLSLAAIGTQMSVLLSQRGDPYQTGKTNKLMSLLMEYAFRKADKYVFQTHQAMMFYDKSIQSRATVIPNPVKQLNRTANRVPDNRIVNVARLYLNHKRQDLLIDAFDRLRNTYSDVTLHFYGNGEDELVLREKARMINGVYLEGVTSHVVEEIENARMFVLTSDHEGIPNALIEAMSLGVPCISTRCSPGGAELLINDGVNGLLVPCNDVDALVTAIKFYLDNPSIAERFGLEAMKIADRFSEDIIYQQWIDFISEKNVIPM